MIRPLYSAAMAVVLAGAVIPASAQQPSEPPKAPPSQQQGQPQGQAKPEEKKEDKNPAAEYEKAVKDLKRVAGAIPVYIRKKEILAELTEDQLGKIFFVQTTINSGVDPFLLQAGLPVGNNFFKDLVSLDPYKFVKSEEAILLMRPNLAYQWNQDSPMAIGAKRSFPEAVLASYRIEQQNPEKKLYLVNVTGLFSGDVTRVNDNINVYMSGYAPNREQTNVEWTDGDAKHTVLRLAVNYVKQPGPPRPAPPLAQVEDDRSAPVKLTYNLYWKDDEGFMPRIGDPRVGFFSSDFFSFEKYNDKDRVQTYINRWDLRKKDPSAALSEPVKPIVWTLDHSIPPQWRDAVREGILFWNKAFERAGFKNVMQVVDAPNDPNYDHADARRNVIRFGASENPMYGAIAIPRNDPFTGKIYNASVVIDASMTQFRYNDFRDVVLPSSFASDRAFQVLTGKHSKDIKSVDQYLFETQADVERRALMDQVKQAGGHFHECLHANHLAAEALFGLAAMSAQPNIKISREEFFKRYLKDTVAHEIGHTLGLRHNFAASTNLTTQQLADDNITNKHGVAASIMEYSPVNILAVLKGTGNFFNTTVGPYDIWAIQYGYTPVKANDPIGEKRETMKIAALSGLPGHAYSTDGDTDSWNPLVYRSDLAKDPLNYATKVLEGVKRAKSFAIEKLPAPGTSFDDRTDLVLLTMNRLFNQGRIAARWVGGVEGRRQFKGDKGQVDTLKPVDAATQRKAMNLITGSILVPNPFDLPTNVLNNLNFENEASWAGSNPAPVRNMLASQQMSLLATLMSFSTTNRIAENAYKQAGTKDVYGMDEHYDHLTRSVFSEVGKNQSVNALRRDLQRFMVSGLMIQASSPANMINSDTKVVANHQLKQLRSRLNVQLANAKSLDSMSRIHLRDLHDEIGRFLDRKGITVSE